MAWGENYGSNEDRSSKNHAAEYAGILAFAAKVEPKDGGSRLVLDVGTVESAESEPIPGFFAHRRAAFEEKGFEYRTSDIRGGADDLWDALLDWPYEDGSVAAVLLSHVLEHVQDPLRVLSQAYRVLESGGRLHVRVPFNMELHFGPPETPDMNDFWRITPMGMMHLIRAARFPEDEIVIESTGELSDWLPADWPVTMKRLFPIEVIGTARKE